MMPISIEKRDEEVGIIDHQQRYYYIITTLFKPLISFLEKWRFLLINGGLAAIGNIGGILMLRFYFIHGGQRKWLSAWLQTSAFPILLIPNTLLYLRHRHRHRHRLLSPTDKFFAPLKLYICGAVLGILFGLQSFLYALGVDFLPVSTFSLLSSTQLAFTAVFAFLLVRHKLTPYSYNVVVLMSLGSVLIGVSKNSDRPHGVTSAQYSLGFLLSLVAAALLGISFPLLEVAFTRVVNNINYAHILQFQFCSAASSTLCCTLGMLINKDFAAMTREAKTYGLGESKYYVALVFTAVLWTVGTFGSVGLIFCSSSFAAGVFSSTLLPMTEIAAAIAFHEKFTGEKGLALALNLWGFVSYLYGTYREEKKVKQINGSV
ncbi:hypothetical protein Scep_003445 [Stephania cephalantha]|uniref:Probable purine permease n=1 Tax=Stephania cephalantha TaxID=152367 RepID=A0AAP0KQM9_9MAGN